MPSLLHFLKMPHAAARSLVRRESLAAVWREIASAELTIRGTREARGPAGASFIFVPPDDWHPFLVHAGADGIYVEPGLVNNVYAPSTGGTSVMPQIGGVKYLDDPDPPYLDARFYGVVAIELKIQFNHGPLGFPYSSDAEFTAIPQVKWLEDISVNKPTISSDVDTESTGTFAYPLALVTAGKIRNVVIGDVYLRTFVTSIC